METRYGGIEAGGTKFVCVVGSGPERIEAETRIATTTPEETMAQIVRFFRPQLDHGGVAAVGIGAFGPLDLDPRSPTYGYITTTPKPGWAGYDICGEVSRALGVPARVDTDVNAAALSEQVWVEANRAMDPLVYITVGTGIGVGVVVNGQPLHGLMHPEGGHAFVPHDWEEDPFTGVCPYHHDCLEGLASGPAMAQRWRMPAERLPGDHPGWALEARYLALGICNLIYHLSPRRIVLGGGVMQHPGLIEQVRRQVTCLLNGYIQSALLDQIDSYIVLPTLGQRTGVFGALALAKQVSTNPGTSAQGRCYANLRE